jgi:hypothetical protein
MPVPARWLRVALASLGAVLGACDDAPLPETARTEPVGLAWHSLGTWSGRGDRQTESFDVTTGALRLSWSATNESRPGAGSVRVTLHSSISGRPLQTILDTPGVGEGSVEIGDEPRVAYLQIESSEIDWSVRLEEAVRGQPPEGGSPR